MPIFPVKTAPTTVSARDVEPKEKLTITAVKDPMLRNIDKHRAELVNCFMWECSFNDKSGGCLHHNPSISLRLNSQFICHSFRKKSMSQSCD